MPRFVIVNKVLAHSRGAVWGREEELSYLTPIMAELNPADERCILARLGDALRHVLPYCQKKWLLKLDRALTNHHDRETCWMPILRGLDISKDCGLAVDRWWGESLWLAQLTWIIKRGLRLPTATEFLVPYHVTVSKFVGAIEKAFNSDPEPPALSIEKICFGTKAGSMMSPSKLQLISLRCPNLSHIDFGDVQLRVNKPGNYSKEAARHGHAPARRLLSADMAWHELSELPWAGFHNLQYLRMLDSRTGAVTSIGMDIVLDNCPLLTGMGITVETPSMLQTLCSAVRLRSVELKFVSFRSPFEERDYEHIQKLCNLHTLKLVDCGTADVLLKKAHTLPLHSLVVTSSDFRSQEGFGNIAALTGLTSLELRCCKQVTDASIAALSGLTNLQELEVAVEGDAMTDAFQAHAMTDVCVEHMVRCTRLRKLALTGMKLTVKSLALIDASLPLLESLSLEDSLDFSRYCTKEDRSQWEDEDDEEDEGRWKEEEEDDLDADGMPRLPPLDVTSVPALQCLPRLHTLNLRDTKLPDAGLAILLALTSLKELDLRGCHVKTAGLTALLDACAGVKKLHLRDAHESRYGSQYGGAAQKFVDDATRRGIDVAVESESRWGFGCGY